MEDEDEKIRRNLVALSALILIAAWLEIPFSAVVAKFVDGGHIAPEAYKLWVVGFALLIYMGLRYSFSPEGARYESAIQDDLRRMQLDMALNMAQRQVDAFVKSGAEPAILVGNLKQISREHAARMQRVNKAGDEEGLSRIRISISEHRDAPWHFLIRTSWEWSGEKGPAASSGGQPIEVNITGRYRLFIEMTSLLSTWTWSASSIRHLAPAALSFCAASVLCAKVLAAYVSA